MTTPQAATPVARVIGLLTLGWIYLAYTDLRWLLHLHAIHLRIAHSTFSFSYYPYLACNIGYLSTAVIVACVLLFFPASLLRALTPASESARPLSAFWFALGIAIGLTLLVLGIHTILSITMWTVYRSGEDAGWQVELALSALVAVAGVVVCRMVLARRQSGAGQARRLASATWFC